MSKSFQTVSTAIKYRIALFKDRAGRKCLRNLELFMCSIYAPRCSSDYQPLGPCRSQCKTTVRRCNFILKDLIALLPELDNCRQFPLTGCTANRHRSGKLSTKRKSSIETYNWNVQLIVEKEQLRAITLEIRNKKSFWNSSLILWSTALLTGTGSPCSQL